MIKQRRINLIFIGFLFFILNGCHEAKPKAPIVNNDISKYENILEEFNKMIQTFQSLQMTFSFDIVSIENKTNSNNEIINKLKLLPKKEFEKIKRISVNNEFSEGIPSCVISEFNIYSDKIKEVAIYCSIKSKGKEKYTPSQISVENRVKIYTNKNFFEFKGSSFPNNFNAKFYIERKENDGVDRALKLLVDMSLIELISKYKHYHYKDIINDIDKKYKMELKTKKGIYLSDIEYKDIGYDISIKIPKVFYEDDNISFSIDTKGKEGYLYILYIDSTEEVNHLYFTPTEMISGRYKFPRDFGNLIVTVTKDCTNCKEENTKIYIFFSKETILDIKEVTAKKILNIPTFRPVSKAICMPEKREYNLHFAVVDFVVR